MDGRPDRVANRGIAGRGADHREVFVVWGWATPELTHVLDGDDDLEVELLPHPRVDQVDGPEPPLPRRRVALPPGEEAADLRERTLRRRQADALRRRTTGGADEVIEPLERQREVGASLRRRDSVHLVHYDGLDVRQDRLRLAGEQQVQRLGSRHEDVGRCPADLSPLLRRGIAGAAGHPDVRERDAEPARLVRNPCQRRPQVPLHVVRERLQRADVEDPATGGSVDRRGGTEQAVEGPQEGGERLPGPGRGADDRVLTLGDRGPALSLGGRGFGEGALEPPAGRFGKAAEDRIGHDRGTLWRRWDNLFRRLSEAEVALYVARRR